jgi:hypothetical protein
MHQNILHLKFMHLFHIKRDSKGPMWGHVHLFEASLWQKCETLSGKKKAKRAGVWLVVECLHSKLEALSLNP